MFVWQRKTTLHSVRLDIVTPVLINGLRVWKQLSDELVWIESRRLSFWLNLALLKLAREGRIPGQGT